MTNRHRTPHTNGATTTPGAHTHPDDPGPQDPDTTPSSPTARDGQQQGWAATALENESERALLGAMLSPIPVQGGAYLSSPAIIEGRRIVAPEHFCDPRHQAVAAAIYALADDAAVRGIEPLMVGAELARRGQLTKVGGPIFVSDLMKDSVTSTNASWHAERVRAGANRRATYAYAHRVIQATNGVDVDSPDLLERINRVHEKWQADVSATSDNGIVAVGNQTDIITQLVAEWGQPDERGMTTGLHDVDTRINIAPGSVVIIAGRPGSGKSMLAAQIAGHYVEERGEPVLFCSMEMPVRELVERDLARIAGVPLSSSNGKTPLTARESQRLEKAAHEYQQLGTLLFYDDSPDLSMSHVEARYEEVSKIAGPPAVVFIDYVQLMKTSATAENRVQAVGEISRRAKVFGMRTGAIVVLCCQLNRGPESRPNGMPNLADLRESGNLEQDADAVFLVWPAADYVEDRAGEVDLIIAKQRRGGHNIIVPLADYRAFAAFRNLTKQKEPARSAPPVNMPDLDAMPGQAPPSNDRNGDDWWNK